MNPEKAAFAQESDAADARPRSIDGADLFLGLSGPGVLTGDDGAADGARTRSSSRSPTRTPRSTRPRRARANPDAIIATGRSDYPNQVNNVLCFPFIFRGALDVGATEINDAMQIACVEGIAALARASSSRRGGGGLPGRAAVLRARLPDPQGLRSAAARHRRRRRRRGGDGDRRGHAPGRRPRGLQGGAEPVGLPLGLHHAAGVRGRRTRDGRRIVFAEGEDERVLHAPPSR